MAFILLLLGSEVSVVTLYWAAKLWGDYCLEASETTLLDIGASESHISLQKFKNLNT